MKKIIFTLAAIGGVMIGAAMIGAKDRAINKGAEIILINGGKARDIHFPHRRHQDSLSDCKICHDLFPAEAGSITELKAQGKLKKNR